MTPDQRLLPEKRAEVLLAFLGIPSLAAFDQSMVSVLADGPLDEFEFFEGFAEPAISLATIQTTISKSIEPNRTQTSHWTDH